MNRHHRIMMRCSLVLLVTKHARLDPIYTIWCHKQNQERNMAHARYVVANWKMNGNANQARTLVQAILNTQCNINHNTHIILCPPFTLLSQLQNMLQSSSLLLGAQDCHHKSHGAFTGNISAPMLQEAGCTHVIIGHSERRQYHHETDDIIKCKVEAALAAELTPIICVGETLAQREAGEAEKVIANQVATALPNSSDNIIIAYEPVWAIGTGKIPTSEDIAVIHNTIKQHTDIPVLYGGSVNAENAGAILATPHVDGLLVGGASLKEEAFNTICTLAS